MMSKSGNFWILAVLSGVIFFAAQAATLSNYGISWDETLHFRRGQAYLYYFLTGEKKYNLPQVDLQGTNGDPKLITGFRRSFYQNDYHNGEYWFVQDNGHPPVSDIIAAFFNYIFYQRLGILGDIFSYHLYNILISSLLVFLVVAFMCKTFGVVPAIIAGITIASYPLFWSEAHFNIKDPIEAAFFSGSIFVLYLLVRKFSLRKFILGLLFISLALGTKFNILFLPFIIIPYLLILARSGKITIRNINLNFLVVAFCLVVIPFVFLIISWPYLWEAIPGNLLKIFGYYKNIGTGTNYQPDNFLILGFNTFALQWIIYTTPPLFLALFTMGVFSAIKNRDKYYSVTLLWLIWFLVPILRVTLPGSSIYGGVRQILEFLPAMVLIVALGGWEIINVFRGRLKFLIILVLVGSFGFHIINLYRLHPNENVYFNSLIGGLKGASRKDFPSWGNSFGNAYKDGVSWINKNAEEGSKVTLLQGTPSNAPVLWFRKDIRYLVDGKIDPERTYWSGIERSGEYIMELVFNDSGKSFNYGWEYVERFLDPVYELVVDDVAILKIWKNDWEHTKNDFKMNEIESMGALLNRKDSYVVMEMTEEELVSRVRFEMKQEFKCTGSEVFVEISRDGKNFEREKDWIPFLQVGNQPNLVNGKVDFFIAGKKAKYIRLVGMPVDCIENKPQIMILR